MCIYLKLTYLDQETAILDNIDETSSDSCLSSGNSKLKQYLLLWFILLIILPIGTVNIVDNPSVDDGMNEFKKKEKDSDKNNIIRKTHFYNCLWLNNKY